MPNTNKQTVINRDNSRIAGVQKHCSQQTSILVGGVAYTPAQVIQIYQDDLDATQAVSQARTALKGALAKASTVRETADTFDGAFKRCIEGAYAGEPSTLDDFGIVVGVRATPSAATKAAAAVKAEETRKARGVVSKKQRSTIQAPTPGGAATSEVPAPAPAGVGATPAVKPQS